MTLLDTAKPCLPHLPNYATTKKAMGEVKGKATTAETNMRDIMRRANDQQSKK